MNVLLKFEHWADYHGLLNFYLQNDTKNYYPQNTFHYNIHFSILMCGLFLVQILDF